MLNENSIRGSLVDIVKHLKVGDLDQAEATLDALEFERLLRPIYDASKGSQIFNDPSLAFGTDRVHEVGDCLSRASTFVDSGDAESALVEAEAALARWLKGS